MLHLTIFALSILDLQDLQIAKGATASGLCTLHFSAPRYFMQMFSGFALLLQVLPHYPTKTAPISLPPPLLYPFTLPDFFRALM